MATSSTPWPGDWLRGVLEIAVLRCLADGGPSYGYAIALALEEAGLGQVKGGIIGATVPPTTAGTTALAGRCGALGQRHPQPDP